MAAIAFFPWLSCDRSVSFGPFRLLPFQLRKSPGPQTSVPQTTIDAILRAYADRPRNRIRSAALLEVDDWRSGDDIDDHVASRLFLAKEALVFSALSKRRLFSFHRYCNADNFQLVIQKFTPADPEGLVYSTRRRDGGTSNYWSSKEFAFFIPAHVHREHIEFDEVVLELVMRLKEPAWVEAITEFNAANSDSSFMPPYLEMVMMKSAFERLLGIDQQVVSFAKAIHSTLPIASGSSPPEGPLTKDWQAARPNSPSLLDAWAREFCAIRGAAAHGKGRSLKAFVWSQEAHLAFASILFPLVLKAKAHDSGEYFLSDDERTRMSALERYIAHEPFYPTNSIRESRENPWRLIDNEIDMIRISRAMYPERD